MNLGFPFASAIPLKNEFWDRRIISNPLSAKQHQVGTGIRWKGSWFDVHGVQGGSPNLDKHVVPRAFLWYRRIFFLREGFGRIAPLDDFPDGLNREQSVDGRRGRSHENIDERGKIAARQGDLRLDDVFSNHMAVFRCQEAEDVTGVERGPGGSRQSAGDAEASVPERGKTPARYGFCVLAHATP